MKIPLQLHRWLLLLLPLLGLALGARGQGITLANIEQSTLTYPSGSPQITNTLTVTSSNSTNLTGATVQFTSGFVSGQDRLLFTTQNGITGSYNTSTGVLTLNGTTTLANYQTAFRAITYQNVGPPTSTGTRQVQFSATDGSATSTQSRSIVVQAAATVTTSAAGSITTSSAVLGGNVTADGGATVTGRGVVYSATNINPTVGGANTTTAPNGTGTGTFSATASGLTPGTTYYVQAYASNGVGTSYGAVQVFTTAANTPTISTAAAGSVTSSSAALGGNVTASGGASVTGRGVVYSVTSTNGTPTIGGSGVTQVANGSGTGAFSATISGLNYSTSYSVQAYASNSAGTSYGGVQTFTTAAMVPTVSTSAASSITSSSAVLGGNVTASGGASVTARGVVYSPTTANGTPTIGGSSATTAANGAGTGTYSATISGLTSGTSYSVQAYATNSAGTSYGGVQTFTTQAITAAPVVTAPTNNSTTNASPIASFTAPANSTVTVSLSGMADAQYNVGANGMFSIGYSGLAQGTYTLSATAQSSGQVVSAQSNVVTFTVDATPPTATAINRQRPTAATTNATALTFAVTFSEAVTGVDASDFTLTTTAGSVSSSSRTVTGSGSTYTVTVSGVSGNGTVRLDLNASGTSIADAAGNPISGGYTSGQSYSVDQTPPSVTALTTTVGTSGTTTTTSPFPFTVTFSEAVSGFSSSGITVGNGSVTSSPSGTSSGTTFTFTVTPTTAGTATTVTIAANAAQDAAGNQNTASSTYSLTYQPTATVTGIARQTPAAATTATATVSYLVTFSAAVSGVTTNNFTLTPGTGLTGTSITSVSGSGTTYTVIVNTGSGNGTLQLNVANATGLTPSLTNTPYSGTNAVYTIVKNFNAAPQLVLQGAGSPSGRSDVTAFVDGVQVVQNGTNTAVTTALQNNSFESNNLGSSDYLYPTTGLSAAPWAFASQSGVARIGGSGFTPAASGQGSYVAFLQTVGGKTGSTTQSLAVPTGTYQVGFVAAQRTNQSQGVEDQVVNVFLNDASTSNGNVFIGSIQPTNGTYSAFTSATFSVAAPALTATVSTTSSSPTSTAPIPFSVSFSQSVGTSFIAADVSVTNGTVTSGSFSGSGSGPYTFTVTPSAPGTVSVSLAAGVASDANNTGNSASNAVSVQYVPTIAVNPSALPNGTVGVAYSQTLTASGGTAPYRYAITAGALPAGLTLSSSGSLAGTPTAGGTYSFTVTATDASAAPGPYSGTQSYTFTINTPTIVVSPAALPNGTVAVAYSQTITASGGTAPYRYAITAGALPAGLTISSNGSLSGTPTAGGTYSFTVTATDASTGSGPYTGSRSYTLTINAPTIAVNPSTLPPGTAGTPYTQTLTASGGTAPYRYAITAGALPAGLTLSSTGVLSGTSTQSGSFSFTVTATDASTGGGPYSGQQAYTLTVTTQPVTAAPAVTTPANGSAIATTTPTYAGTAPASSTVTVYVDGTVLSGTVTADGSGNWSKAQPTALAQGSHTVRATAQSSGAAVSASSNTNTFTVDTVAPAAPVVTAPASGSALATTTPLYAGTAEANSTVTVYVDGAALSGPVTADGSGNWSKAQPTALSQGAHTVYATAADVAGNASPNSATTTFTVDTVAPSVAISSSAGASGGSTTTSPLPFTVTFSEAVTGFGQSDLTVAGGTVAGFSGSGSTYTFSVTPTSSGTTVTVNVAANVAQDAAGNGNTTSNSYALTFLAPTITVAPASLPGGTQGTAYSATFSASGGAAPYSYAITAGKLPAGLTLTGSTLSGTPTAAGTYNFRVTATDNSAAPGPYSGFRDYSLVIAAPVVMAVTWTGNTSADWYTAGNWNPSQVPDATIDATIPTAPSGNRFPAIGSGTATSRNLTLNSGATLVQTGGTLAVAANLTNNGTLAATGGTVALGGSALSNLFGSGNTRFWNLTVGSSGAQQSTSASTSVQRLLTLNGTFTTNSNPFTLESNAAGTALVVNTGSSAVTGDVTVQRYLDPTLNPGLGYHHYAAPISSATVASLTTASYAPVVNPAYNTSATPARERPFPTVLGYDQARLASTSNDLDPFTKGWYSPASTADALVVGQGYALNVGAGQALAVRGPLNNGDLTQRLARNSGATAADAGLALVGNPYPAPLDWSQVAPADRPGLDGVLYVFQSTSQYGGQYRSYTNGVGGDPVVAQGQGFFVRVTPGQTSGSLTFHNAQRLTTYQNPALYRTAETRPLVQLRLQGSATPYQDDAYVYFQAGATTGLDAEFDAPKLANSTGLNLSTSLPASQQLSIDGRPAPLGTAQLVVPLAVGVPTPGSYSLTAAQLLNLRTTPTYLRDLQTGTLVDLAQQSTYQFSVSNASSLLTGRFELVFSPQQALATTTAALAQQVALYPNPATGMAYVELPASLGRQAVSAVLVDAVGRQVRALTLPAQGAVAHPLDLHELPTGVYTLHLRTSVGTLVKKLTVE